MCHHRVTQPNKRTTMSEEAEMRIDPARAKTLVSQLQGVSERVATAANGRNVRAMSLLPCALHSVPC